MTEEAPPGIAAIAAQFEQVAQLQHASHEVRLRLAMCARLREFEADAMVLRQGDAVDAVHILLQGQVHVTLTSSAGASIWLYSAGPGTMLDPIALLAPPVMPFSVSTLSNSDVAEIPLDCVQDAIDAEPTAGYEMMYVLAQRMYLISRLLDRGAPGMGA